MPKRSPLKLLDYLCLLSSVRKYLSNVWSIYMNYASPFGGQSVSLIVYHFIVKIPLRNCVYLTYMSICDCSVGNCVTELPRNSTSGIMSNGNKITYIQWFKTHTKLNNNISHSDRYLSQSTRLCYQFGATSASSRHLTIVFQRVFFNLWFRYLFDTATVHCVFDNATVHRWVTYSLSLNISNVQKYDYSKIKFFQDIIILHLCSVYFIFRVHT